MSPTSLTGPELLPQSGIVKRVVILLHGVGSNGDDLISLAPMLQDALPDTAFLSPNAPFPFDMAPFGYQWFSLMERSTASMLAGAETAAPHLNAYIDEVRERFKLTDRDIALFGFSQGTMMSLYAGLRRAEPLAGIVGFSGALVGAETVPAGRTPVCLIHGEWDDVVPFGALAMAEAALRAKKISVETHARPNLGHSIDPEGLDAALQFLQTQFMI